MRLFVAVYPPASARADLAERLAGLAVTRAAADGVNTRLAHPENWHVTLAFLGELPDDRAPDAVAAIKRAALADSARPHPERIGAGDTAPEPTAGRTAVRLRLDGGGRFGRGRFTVLWAGVQGDGLDRLAHRVRRELSKAKLPYDRRPFRAHLTLARPGDRLDRDQVEADRIALADYRGPDWPVTEICLMRSYPGPHPSYEQLAACPSSDQFRPPEVHTLANYVEFGLLDAQNSHTALRAEFGLRLARS